MQSSVCLLVVAALAVCLYPAAVSAQVQFSEDWTHGKRDVSSQLRRALPLDSLNSLNSLDSLDSQPQPPRQPSLLDVLTSGAQQAGEQCKPDAEALGLIYDLIMREVEKVISCRTSKGLLKPTFAT